MHAVSYEDDGTASAKLRSLFDRLLETKDKMTALKLLEIHSPPKHRMKNKANVTKRLKLKAKRKIMAGQAKGLYFTSFTTIWKDSRGLEGTLVVPVSISILIIFNLYYL